MNSEVVFFLPPNRRLHLYSEDLKALVSGAIPDYRTQLRYSAFSVGLLADWLEDHRDYLLEKARGSDSDRLDGTVPASELPAVFDQVVAQWRAAFTALTEGG